MGKGSKAETKPPEDVTVECPNLIHGSRSGHRHHQSRWRRINAGQEVEEFDELIKLVQGMRGHIVEASVLLPWDDGRFPVAAFSGTLREVEFVERSPSPRP